MIFKKQKYALIKNLIYFKNVKITYKKYKYF